MKVLYRHFSVFLLCASLGAGTAVSGQGPRKKPAAKKPSVNAVAAKPKTEAPPETAESEDEKTRFSAAIAAATPAEKAELLIKFIADFPRSTNKTRAQESLAGARAAMADEALGSGNNEQALRLFRLAIDEAPKPYSDRFFTEIVSTVPSNLFWRGARNEAYDIARAIEANIAAEPKRLAALSGFYLNVEDGAEARRLAEAAIKLDEAGAPGYQALGMADRLNFDLEDSEKAFAKALELDPGSAAAKRMLAEMKRALGKSEEATALYQEILNKDENDNQARTGYVLSLFDAGKRPDAETELARAMERTPGNVFLLAGAAYWYAANGEGVKAAELAQQAIAKEPRFIWSHIALARGLTAQGKPVEAEQTLVAATKYGNFPTLQYEIASARFAAGFYRDAVEELRKSFTVDADGVKSKLGGRVDRSGKNFTDLVSYERRASIFTPKAADNPETADQLRALLELDQVLSLEKPDEAAAIAAAERFAGGGDEMATFRRLYVSRALNEKQIAPEKSLEYSRSAIARVDTALNVANPAAAVMASELYEARATAFSNNDFLLIPEVPKQMLSAILRGRIEESTGVALLHNGNAAEANVRFRRALSVLPKDSAWWRSATWNLGRALEAEGKDQEALRAYIASYKIDKPNIARYLTINSLYKKVNGSADGLETEVGPSPLANTVANIQPAAPVPEPSAASGKPAETPVEKAPAVKALPAALPVAAEQKTSEVANAEPKNSEPETPAEVKQQEPKPLEEKPVEVKNSEAAAAKQPEEKSAEKPATETAPEVKPVDEKKETTVEEKLAEVKKDSVTETTEKPIDAPKPADAEPEPKPEEKKETPAVIPVEPSKENKPLTETPAETKEPVKDPVEEKPKSEEPTSDPPASDPPKPQNSEVETHAGNSSANGPEPRPSERKRLAVVKTDLTLPKRGETKPPAATSSARRSSLANDPTRPLFESVVIKVPGGANKSSETERPLEEPVAAKEPAQSDRVRVTDATKTCTVGVSQENISISGEDGTVAVLVSVDEGVDIASVKGIANDAEIEVHREPRIAGIDDRVVYVLRSLSGKAGMYQVSFLAPCGRKTVTVRVR